MKRTHLPLAAMALIYFSLPAVAADPAWWAARGVTNGNPSSNLSPATIGQAKHMAAMALVELGSRLSAEEFLALKNAVAAVVDLEVPALPPGYHPAPPPPGYIGPNNHVLLVGELKALAEPFYDHLRLWNSVWLDNEMIEANIRVVEPGSNPSSFSPYPWSVATSDDANKAMASLGQLKAVFSLRLEAACDTDGDGVPDAWEMQHGLDPGSDDSGGDPDTDGLTNLQEFVHSTKPFNADSDGDLLPDGWEVRYGLNPLSSSGNDGMNGDPDQDGLLNIDELIHGSSPVLADTDGDGANDFLEVTQGSDPADAGDGGQPPPPEDIAFVRLTVGDPSGSESERYNMIVKGVEGDTRTITHQAKEFGVVSTKSYQLRKGAKYEVEIVHSGTKPSFSEQHGFSNYDWIADIQPDGFGVLLEPAVLVKKDPHTIFTEVIDWPNSTFQIKDKKAELFVMKFKTETFSEVPAAARGRKKLGVKEDVSVSVTPKSVGTVNWSLHDQLDAIVTPNTGSSVFFTADTRAKAPSLRATFDTGDTHDIGWEVVIPSGETAIPMSKNTYLPGAQGAGIKLEITTQPVDVSFYNVRMIEIDKGTSNIDGYFETHTPPVHKPTLSWEPLNQENKWDDEAWFEGFPRPWSWGTYQWEIEVRWRTIYETGQGEFLANRPQLHTIHDSSGKSTVSKMERSAERTP